jgi:hypothetical protein
MFLIVSKIFRNVPEILLAGTADFNADVVALSGITFGGSAASFASAAFLSE